MNTFICYDRCGTCKKAEKWLGEHGIEFEKRPIKEDNPSAEELKNWIEQSGIPARKFFNTNGQLYKSLGIKDKLSIMSDEEQTNLLATDGMLVKRPIFLTEDGKVLVGFKEQEWQDKLI